jgi:hypothetical protein
MKNDSGASLFGGFGTIKALAILLAAAALLVFALRQWQSGAHSTDGATAPGASPNASVPLTFGEFQPITGTPYLIAGLSPRDESRNGYGSFYGKGEGGLARNYLLLRGDTQESHFLLPDNARVVRSLDQMYAGKGTNAYLPTQWLYAEIIEADTNQDKTLDDDDRFSIAIADPDGARLTVVLSDVASVLGKSRLRSDALLLLYAKGGKSWASEIDLTHRRIVRTTELPTQPLPIAPRTPSAVAL